MPGGARAFKMEFADVTSRVREELRGARGSPEAAFCEIRRDYSILTDDDRFVE